MSVFDQPFHFVRNLVEDFGVHGSENGDFDGLIGQVEQRIPFQHFDSDLQGADRMGIAQAIGI